MRRGGGRSVAALAAAWALAAAVPGAAQVALTGAGSTFFNPLATRWTAEYERTTGLRINYQSIGSGGGIRQFIEGTVDFGATDGPMTDRQIATVQGNVLHLPVVLGAVGVTYHLPGLAGIPLRLDGATLADIFLGRIIRWNDRRIAALNPGVRLPALDVIVVHRSDGSGTTYVFVDFLSKVSPEWRERVGVATSVNWPVGLGGKGNEGVTQQVKQVEGAISYVELAYARVNRLPVALIRNAAGNFVSPRPEATSAAAASAGLAPGTDFRVSITNAPGLQAYPIASFVWLLARRDGRDSIRSRRVRDFVLWAAGPDAQRLAASLDYAPLPTEVARLVAASARTMTAGGRPL